MEITSSNLSYDDGTQMSCKAAAPALEYDLSGLSPELG
jgi:hypothetical protein